MSEHLLLHFFSMVKSYSAVFKGGGRRERGGIRKRLKIGLASRIFRARKCLQVKCIHVSKVSKFYCFCSNHMLKLCNLAMSFKGFPHYGKGATGGIAYSGHVSHSVLLLHSPLPYMNSGVINVKLILVLKVKILL